MDQLGWAVCAGRTASARRHVGQGTRGRPAGDQRHRLRTEVRRALDGRAAGRLRAEEDGLQPLGRRSPFCRNAGAVECRTAPVQLYSTVQLLQQSAMQGRPHACPLPITQPLSARHPRTASHLLWQVLPRQTSRQHEQNTGDRRERGTSPCPTNAPTAGFVRRFQSA